MRIKPARLSAAARVAYQPIASALRRIGQSMPDAPDELLAEKIEETMQAELMVHVCRPLGVNDGACLVGAIIVARGFDLAV